MKLAFPRLKDAPSTSDGALHPPLVPQVQVEIPTADQVSTQIFRLQLVNRPILTYRQIPALDFLFIIFSP